MSEGQRAKGCTGVLRPLRGLKRSFDHCFPTAYAAPTQSRAKTARDGDPGCGLPYITRFARLRQGLRELGTLIARFAVHRFKTRASTWGSVGGALSFAAYSGYGVTSTSMVWSTE